MSEKREYTEKERIKMPSTITLLLLRDAKDDCVKPFVENIDSVNRLYNQPIEMVYNQENNNLGSA